MDTVNLLVVDDEEITAELLENLLNKAAKQLGKSVRVFKFKDNDVDVLFASIKTLQIKVAFIDIYMPCIMGYEVMNHIREIAPEITIIADSSDTEPETIEKTKNMGAQEFLPKPYNYTKLMGFVEKYV